MHHWSPQPQNGVKATQLASISNSKLYIYTSRIALPGGPSRPGPCHIVALFRTTAMVVFHGNKFRSMEYHCFHGGSKFTSLKKKACMEAFTNYHKSIVEVDVLPRKYMGVCFFHGGSKLTFVEVNFLPRKLPQTWMDINWKLIYFNGFR